MHDVIVLTVPFIALTKPCALELEYLRNEMTVRLDRVDAKLRYFHGVTGKFDGRLEAIMTG